LDPDRQNVIGKGVDLAVFKYAAGLGRAKPWFVVFTRTAAEVAVVEFGTSSAFLKEYSALFQDDPDMNERAKIGNE